MVKSLVLHIGDPKTGTSSIQKVLFERRWACDSVSLDYPDVLSQLALATALRPGANKEDAEDQLGRYAFWLENSPADVAVLSAEQFSLVNPVKLAAAFERHFGDLAREMRVIAYAKPHPSRLTSAYAQRIKSGQLTASIERLYSKMLGTSSLRMHGRFSKWSAVFSDRLTVRPMVRSHLVQGDVVADLVSFAVGGAPFSLSGSTEANVSLPLEALAGLKLVQGALRRNAPSGLMHAIGNHIAELATANNKMVGTKLVLPGALARRMREALMDDALAMDRDFMGGPLMADALEKAALAPEDVGLSLEPGDHFLPRQIERLRRNARRLAKALNEDAISWNARHKRDRGRKPHVLQDDKLSDTNLKAAEEVEEICVRIADILVAACRR